MNTMPSYTRKNGRVSVVSVTPEIDGGRFPIKRVIGDVVRVKATVVADGHDALQCLLLIHPDGVHQVNEIPMTAGINDQWTAEFTLKEPGRYSYSVEGWIDQFVTWQRAFKKRVEAHQDVAVEILIGAEMIKAAGQRAQGSDAEILNKYASLLSDRADSAEERSRIALEPNLLRLMNTYPDRSNSSTYGRELFVVADRPRVRFGAWYELFPRSVSPDVKIHGTFRTCEARLPEIASMGFDVVYIPPIHPIGISHRKGPNNSVVAGQNDVGSPWAIGNHVGGHTAIHPELGTLDDFRHFLDAAKQHQLEVAIDIAFQCSPDHPYVREHPEWFRTRPDGSIQYAENPPKKYEDIYPFDFDTKAWEPLWEELSGVVKFWAKNGVRIFRVDNPHTKPLSFWEWLINNLKQEYPELIFLSEAFTRPAMMYQLAKVGFSQSYNYFPWKNKKWELEQYFTELTHSEPREYFRYNLWPNTPDILTEYLQHGGRAGFVIRYILAATLGASYGIYGPAFELCEDRPRAPGTEEYLRSEKYEIKHWDTERPGNLNALISHVNDIRRANPALQRDDTLTFHPASNENLICYSKQSNEGTNIVVVVVNLDPHRAHSGTITLPLNDFKLENQPYRVRDVLTGISYLWKSASNFVELNPQLAPAHIFLLEKA